MKKLKSSAHTSSETLNLTRITRTLFFIGIFYGVSIIMFDSGNLLTREAVAQRWALLSMLLVATTAVWYFNAQKSMQSDHRQMQLTALLVSSTLIFAGFTTYWERGMASTSTIFYILPLLIVATLKNRHALTATAALAAITYAFSTVKYFNDFFNEGYRVQLWGHMLLYIGFIFGATWLIMIIAGLRHDSK